MVMSTIASIEDYLKLARLERIEPSLAGILSQNGGANITVCPECHIDDFVHGEGCSLLKLLEEEEQPKINGMTLTSAPEDRRLIISEVDYEDPGMLRLAQLGIVIGTEIEIIKNGDPMLIALHTEGNLFAFERRMCENVTVVISRSQTS